MMNYHEMVMEEPSSSPARRQQHAIITAIMAASLSYIVMVSGVMQSVDPTVGMFPGGSFCYKLAHRDYAASMGMSRQIMADATSSEDVTKFTNVERRLVEPFLYHVFLDNPFDFPGRALRWATGMLVNGTDGGDKHMADKLMELNNRKGKGGGKKRQPTQTEMMDLSASTVMEMLPYQMTKLPSVPSLVLQFPNSHGFASALVTSYKIIPSMRKLAKKRGVADPVVIATCRKAEEMCTIYVPLEKTESFLLGHLDSDTYKSTLPVSPSLFTYGNLKQSIRKLAPFARKYIDEYLP